MSLQTKLRKKHNTIVETEKRKSQIRILLLLHRVVVVVTQHAKAAAERHAHRTHNTHNMSFLRSNCKR
uniref:Uncharacterized protein n=1 Tax=Anopheles arabiensis TaxID=7173 RepID=A0A182IGV0_ANOAR